MNVQKDIEAKVQTLLFELEKRLGIKTDDLAQGLRRAGRRLPRRVRAKAKVLVDAQAMTGNPKLARQVDASTVRVAFDAVTTHLRGIDVRDARNGRRLSLAGAVVFNLLLVLAAFFAWLWWQGYV
ncbi:hypothetical protein C1J03_04690 [Sulfitobacter sp. SK012]|uniref:hypothetical protein n=1 Tax=Sulfitobacter sp. SK012 TaxID=1389005 RepID=UPI000E0C90C7|nr:hypothetical protein [Sulfitobacter sp. SK012]AXI45396.1 hypothetical protein C1J03_04690 [Sulfitobacter sp. SK012]